MRPGWRVVLLFALAAGVAKGHIVLGTPTLQLRTLQSDVVARVRIVEPAVVFELEDPPLRETVVVAEVLELLKGRASGKQLRFVQQGHGVVRYAAGDEVVLFVDRIAKSPELAGSRVAAHVAWVSQQETGAKYAVDEETREDFSAAVRGYAGLAGLDAKARREATRRLTLDLLASPHEALATSALRDIVLASKTELFTKADLPALTAVLDDPARPIGIRIGLLAELERRGLVAGPPRWAALLHASRGSDRLAVVRAVAAHPSEPVARELTALLASEDSQLVAAAAVSFGSLGSEVAVAPLADLIANGPANVRQAAIRGLGRVGSPAAIQALSNAAATNPDPATRRRAAAEVKVLARSATPPPSPGAEPLPSQPE